MGRPMFVDVGHMVEDGKRVRGSRARAAKANTTKAVVRLYALDDCHCVGVNARKSRCGMPLEGGATTLVTWVDDRKLDVLASPSSGVASQVEDEIVEGGSQIVEDITDHERPVPRDRLSDPDAERILRVFSIGLDFEAVRLAVDVGDILGVMRIQVPICPPETRFDQFSSIA